MTIDPTPAELVILVAYHLGQEHVARGAAEYVTAGYHKERAAEINRALAEPE